MWMVKIILVCLIPELNWAAKLWIEPKGEDLVLVEGDKLRLDCKHEYNQHESSEGMFKKDGKIISVANANGYSISLQKVRLNSGDGISSTITLSKDYVTVSDSGNFTCDIQTKSVIISVIIIKVVPEDAEITNKSSMYVELSCGVQNPPENLPFIQWTWLRGNQLLQNNEKYSIPTQSYDGILRIKNPNRTDLGKYECLLGEEDEIATRKSTHLKGKPSIVHLTCDYNALKCICEATGYPRPTIKWDEDGNEFTTSEIIDESEISITSELRIENKKTSDYGTYTCAAHSDLGEGVKDSYKFDGSESTLSQAVSSGVSCTHAIWNKRLLFILLIVKTVCIYDVICS
ncbi:Roundabout 1 [Mactra antiquata]